jgi:anti-anti-sigma factor
MPSPLQITTQTFQRVPVVRVSGDLIFGHDVSELPQLARQLSAQGNTDAILDLRGLTSTDSTGLGAVLEFRRLLGDGNKAVYLLQPPERLRAHMTVTHVETMFIVVESEDDLGRYLTERRA